MHRAPDASSDSSQVSQPLAAELAAPPAGQLLSQLLRLAMPIMAEQLLNLLVGLNDTYLANHLPREAANATAAVGTIAYVLWLIGLIVSAIATGSTAIIARAKGAHHRSLANSVCGQSAAASVVMGLISGLIMYLLAEPIVKCTGLAPAAQTFALAYLRLLAFTMPFTMFMQVASACQRGAGDTVTPAVVMIVVDVINIVSTFGLTRGYWGLPARGFDGIALGTCIAYFCGGAMQVAALMSGRGEVRLYLHRLRPHWITIKRILRIGIPAGVQGLITWVAQFIILIIINKVDASSVMAAAHINAVRIESLSFLPGFAFAVAASTMVGQSLGMKNPARATRSAHLAYAVGGGIMTIMGLTFIFFGRHLAGVMSADPGIIHLTTWCLFLTGFVQCGFAASIIFGFALQGAGDTRVVMVLNLLSIVGVRFTAVLIVALWLRLGLVAIWAVLTTELMLRGVLLYTRFATGRWRHIKV